MITILISHPIGYPNRRGIGSGRILPSRPDPTRPFGFPKFLSQLTRQDWGTR